MDDKLEEVSTGGERGVRRWAVGGSGVVLTLEDEGRTDIFLPSLSTNLHLNLRYNDGTARVEEAHRLLGLALDVLRREWSPERAREAERRRLEGERGQDLYYEMNDYLGEWDSDAR